MSGFDEEFDFVVVGSGGGSMCAGLVMRSVGKSVIVLEKTGLVGGTTAKSGGAMWIPNNPFMKRAGIEDSYEKAEAYLDSVVGDLDDAPAASRERRRAYLREAPRMVEFLVSQGVKLTRMAYYPDYYDEQPGSSVPGRTVVAELFDVSELGAWKHKLRPGWINIPAPLWEAAQLPRIRQSWRIKLLAGKIVLRGILAKVTGKVWANAGRALQGRMLQAALRAKVEIRTDSPVSELIEENGAIVGVVTVKDGSPWRVRAGLGVLINAGGFANNQRMRDLYMPGTTTKWSYAAEGDTGEMIEEMLRHGAAIAQMNERIGHPATLAPGSEGMPLAPSGQSLAAGPHAILVDQDGVRYMNEAGSYMARTKTMFERPRSSPSYAIFDDYVMRNYMVAHTMPGSPKPKSWYESGYLKKAGTIEELARQLSMEPARLKATVDRFNGFCANGRDEDFRRGDSFYDRFTGDPFHKPNESLGPVDEPPYYAVPVVPADTSTYGGVVTDTHARVRRPDGSVIPGLYATGVSAASVMGGFYPGAGSSIGPSFTWGYVAAKHAANADNLALLPQAALGTELKPTMQEGAT